MAMTRNKALERLNLLKKYGERTGKPFDADKMTTGKSNDDDGDIPEIELGVPLSSNVGVNNSATISKHKIAAKSARKSSIEEELNSSYNAIVNSEVATDFFDEDEEDDDLIFRPKEFSRRTEEREKDTINLYEELKSRISDIDCSVDVDSIYEQFDNILKSLSSCSNEDLTNSQVVILVSTMITKLEEMNKHNYPEIKLADVKNKLTSEGNQAINSGSVKDFFFERFYKYYDDIEFKQFSSLTEKYMDRLEQFSEFQKKKSHMLITLLKWLLD